MKFELSEQQALTLCNALDKAEELIDSNDKFAEVKLNRLREVNRIITHSMCSQL